MKPKSQEVQRIQTEIGSLIRRTRKRSGLSIEGMGKELGYHPTLICKIEKGRNISAAVMDSLLKCKKLSRKEKNELKRLRELLENIMNTPSEIALEDVPAADDWEENDIQAIAQLNNTQTNHEIVSVDNRISEKLFTPQIERLLHRGWQVVKPRLLQITGVVLLAIAIIAGSIRGYSLIHRIILGPIDFARACLEQYPNEPDVKAVLLDEYSVYAWKCELTAKNGSKILADISAISACRMQYTSKAIQSFKNVHDAHSWYCYVP